MRCSATGMMIALKHERDRRGDVEMRRVLDIGLPGDRQRQHQGVQREDVEQRVEPVLVEHHEAHQHQRRRPADGRVEGEMPCITSSCETKQQQRRRAGRASAPRRGSPARGTPASWRSRSRTRQQDAADGQLARDRRRSPTAMRRCGRRRRRRQAPGHEDAGDQRHVEQQLQHRRQLDHRQMAAGIFQHHGLVHHGQLEMRRRIVDRNAARSRRSPR